MAPDLNAEPGAGIIIIIGEVIYEDRFLIAYPYECYHTSMDEVPETLPDLLKYGFYVQDSPAMKAIGQNALTPINYSIR